MFLKKITLTAVVASLLGFAASDVHAGGFKISIGGGGKSFSFGGSSCHKSSGCYQPRTYYYHPAPKPCPPPAPPLAKVPAGSLVSMPYIRYGNRPGYVVLSMPGVKLQVQVTHWEMNLVQVKLPELPLAGPTKAALMVVRSDGYHFKPLALLLVPAPIQVPVQAAVQPAAVGTPAVAPGFAPAAAPAAAAAPAVGAPIILNQPAIK